MLFDYNYIDTQVCIYKIWNDNFHGRQSLKQTMSYDHISISVMVACYDWMQNSVKDILDNFIWKNNNNNKNLWN